jgi:hypothetical protein
VTTQNDPSDLNPPRRPQLPPSQRPDRLSQVRTITDTNCRLLYARVTTPGPAPAQQPRLLPCEHPNPFPPGRTLPRAQMAAVLAPATPHWGLHLSNDLDCCLLSPHSTLPTPDPQINAYRRPPSIPSGSPESVLSQQPASRSLRARIGSPVTGRCQSRRLSGVQSVDSRPQDCRTYGLHNGAFSAPDSPLSSSHPPNSADCRLPSTRIASPDTGPFDPCRLCPLTAPITYEFGPPPNAADPGPLCVPIAPPGSGPSERCRSPSCDSSNGLSRACTLQTTPTAAILAPQSPLPRLHRPNGLHRCRPSAPVASPGPAPSDWCRSPPCDSSNGLSRACTLKTTPTAAIPAPQSPLPRLHRPTAATAAVPAPQSPLQGLHPPNDPTAAILAPKSPLPGLHPPNGLNRCHPRAPIAPPGPAPSDRCRLLPCECSHHLSHACTLQTPLTAAIAALQSPHPSLLPQHDRQRCLPNAPIAPPRPVPSD